MAFRGRNVVLALSLMLAAATVATSQSPLESPPRAEIGRFGAGGGVGESGPKPAALPAAVPSTPAPVPVPGQVGFRQPPILPSTPTVQTGAAGEMIGFSHADPAGNQTIALVHAGKSWIAVYHVDRSGTIRLVSSRPIDADFSLQLNATSPLPEEIRRIGRR